MVRKRIIWGDTVQMARTRRANQIRGSNAGVNTSFQTCFDAPMAPKTSFVGLPKLSSSPKCRFAESNAQRFDRSQDSSHMNADGAF